jgi:tetratricopeptide (TPR) repeat protein
MSTTDKKTDIVAVPESGLDTEALLLQRLKNTTTEEEYFRWMLFVVGFYRGINKIDAAVQLLQGFIDANQNQESVAHCHLALGQIATDEQRFDAALKHFNEALSLSPEKRKVKYVLHNNIAFCFNKLSRFGDAERYCRLAIEIDWTRASAYRNLGLSLQGQGDLTGAAWALVEAMKLDATDNRARAVVEQMVAAHPSLAVQCPWVNAALHSDVKCDADMTLM